MISNGGTVSIFDLSRILFILTLLELAVNRNLALSVTMNSYVKTIVFEDFLSTFKCDVMIDNFFRL